MRRSATGTSPTLCGSQTSWCLQGACAQRGAGAISNIFSKFGSGPTDTHRFHTPRNILCALVGEVGELAECFQWKGEVARGLPDFPEKEKVHIGEELADVLIYTVRLAHVCDIPLETCIPRKMAMNGAKYPADKARGRSDKYTAYQAFADAGGRGGRGAT